MTLSGDQSCVIGLRCRTGTGSSGWAGSPRRGGWFDCFVDVSFHRLVSQNGAEWHLRAESKDGLDGDVHNHHTLGTEVEGQDLESITDEQTRETDIVEDTEDPDEDDLGIAKSGLGGIAVVHGGHDGPEGKGDGHAWDQSILAHV